ncbi:MAG: hypothetical protein J6U50_07780 [Lachnospiraceae bacterium]|nr:hypothetical protein [Lachnospiraceae bacterium]
MPRASKQSDDKTAVNNPITEDKTRKARSVVKSEDKTVKSKTAVNAEDKTIKSKSAVNAEDKTRKSGTAGKRTVRKAENSEAAPKEPKQKGAKERQTLEYKGGRRRKLTKEEIKEFLKAEEKKKGKTKSKKTLQKRKELEKVRKKNDVLGM